MFKALLRKQLMEVNVWLIQNRKKGTRRSQGSRIGLVVLYIGIFCSLGSLFYGAGLGLCKPLLDADLGWMYHAMMGMMALFLGILGSVFNTYSTIYRAKDNEFLLSMPIAPWKILAVRLLGVWMWSLIYSLIAIFPGELVYWQTAAPGAAVVVLDLLMMPVLSLLALTLSCVLGWAVAWVTARMKHRSLATVILSLAFFAAYYFVYFRANQILKDILNNAQQVGQMLGSIYPLYLLGQAFMGHGLAALGVTAGNVVLLLAVFAAMNRSFLHLATAKSGSKKRAYRLVNTKQHSPAEALLRKEFFRLTASPTYMLNCAMGTLMLAVGGVAALIYGNKLLVFLEAMEMPRDRADLLAVAALCMAGGLNDLTAPSVSLEGKNLWLVQSLPVTPWMVLRGKLSLHLRLTLIPMVFCAGCLMAVLRPGVLLSAAMLIVPMLFVLLTAQFGLMVNLKAPNLKWTNEVAPIKQSMGAMLTMLGSWAFVMVLAGLYLLLYNRISPLGYLGIAGVLLALMCAVLHTWLRKRGTRIFAAL